MMTVSITLDQDLSEGTIEIVEYDFDINVENREAINNNVVFNNSTITFTPTKLCYQIRYYENNELVRTSKWIRNTQNGTFNDNNTIVIFEDNDNTEWLEGWEEYDEETEETTYEPPTFEGYLKMATPLAGGPEEPNEFSSIPWQNDGYDLSNLKIGIWYGSYNNPDLTKAPDQIVDVDQDGGFSTALDVENNNYYARWKVINSGADSPLYGLYGEYGS